MELNMATAIRAELEANKNKYLLGGAAIAINSFYNLQKNISLKTEGLSLFEDVVPPIAYSKPKDDAKTKSKGDIIPITESGNSSNNEKSANKKGKSKSKDQNKQKGQKTKKVPRKKGPSGKPRLHFINKKTKKEAYEAAKRAGKGEPIQHAHPKKGKPHFHPNDNPNDCIGLEEYIQKDGVHFTYPK